MVSEHSEVQPQPRADMANEVAIGIVAGMFWMFFAGIGVVVVGVIGLSVAFATWVNKEPDFSAPIEWRSTAQSDDWRGEETPVVVRLESDGSAWVEAFPITPSSALPWPGWANNCYDK